MNIINLLISWDWCNQTGVQGVFSLLKSVVNVVRIAVPIILVIMTTLDVIKKIIDPNEKEGQQKILRRAIAAVIVFFIPTMIRMVFIVIDWGAGKDGTYNNAQSGLSSCWK